MVSNYTYYTSNKPAAALEDYNMKIQISKDTRLHLTVYAILVALITAEATLIYYMHKVLV
jgi:hypothetical protein